MIEWFAPHRGPVIAAFVDRDGVLNEHIENGYVLGLHELRWIPGALDGLRRLDTTGMGVVIVSNQSCVNRGLLSAGHLVEIMDGMVSTMNAAGIRCYGWITCPHRPDEHCSCRKPGTAMLERAANVIGVDLKRSVLFGDSASDIEAAGRVGMAGVLVPRNEAGALRAAVERFCETSV